MTLLVSRLSRLLALAAGLLASGFVAAKPISLEGLPVIEPATVPRAGAAPRFIPARERAPGFVVHLPNRELGNYLGVRDADFSASSEDAGASVKCLAIGVPLPDDFRGASSDLERLSRGNVYHYLSHGERVLAVRAERWLEAGERAGIEITELWVDARTGGARLARRSFIEPRRVAVPHPGLEIYAVRRGENEVDFIVRQVPSPELLALAGASLAQSSGDGGLDRRAAQLRSLAQQRRSMTVASASGRSSQNPCGYARATLRLENENSDLATINAELVLIEEPGVSDRTAEALRVGGAEPENFVGALRLRSLAVQLGLSRLSADPAPVATLSYRWLDSGKRFEF